jgi:hypothetical protein
MHTGVICVAQVCLRLLAMCHGNLIRAAIPCQPVPRWSGGFLGWFAMQSHSTMLATYLIGHPLRLGLNLVSTLGMLFIATLGANTFCTVTAASMTAEMEDHFSRLNIQPVRSLHRFVIWAYVGHPVGQVPDRGFRACSSLIVEWEVATCIGTLIAAVVYEVFQRRAFLVSRWELIGPGGLDRARAWPLGDVRGVKMCTGVAASFLYGGVFIWTAFTWSYSRN